MALWQKQLLSHCWQPCLLCRQPHQHALLCASCWQSRPNPSRCPQCGQQQAHSWPCGNCLRHPPPWQQLFCLADHQAPWSDWVIAAKQQQHRAIGYQLGLRLAQLISPRHYDYLCCIPRHWLKTAWYGHNPAQQIASGVADALALPLAADLLQRTHWVTAQKSLKRRQRLRQQQNSMRVSYVLSGKVLLIDDVITTGATLFCASQLLLKAGAQQVDVACITRA